MGDDESQGSMTWRHEWTIESGNSGLKYRIRAIRFCAGSIRVPPREHSDTLDERKILSLNAKEQLQGIKGSS